MVLLKCGFAAGERQIINTAKGIFDEGKQPQKKKKKKLKKKHRIREGTNPPENQISLPVYIQLHIDNKTRLFGRI
jgi:hypothetical protein